MVLPQGRLLPNACQDHVSSPPPDLGGAREDGREGPCQIDRRMQLQRDDLGQPDSWVQDPSRRQPSAAITVRTVARIRRISQEDGYYRGRILAARQPGVCVKRSEMSARDGRSERDR